MESYTEQWDGRDDAGNAVPPGNYMVVLEVKSGIGNFVRAGSIAVAYWLKLKWKE